MLQNHYFAIRPEGRKTASIVTVEEVRKGIGIKNVGHKAFREMYSSSVVRFFGFVSR